MRPLHAGDAAATADEEIPAWRIFLPLWLALLKDAASTAAAGAATPAAPDASSRSLDTKRGPAAGSSQGTYADPRSAAELAGSSMQALQGAVYGATLQSVLDTIEQLDLQLVQVADPQQVNTSHRGTCTHIELSSSRRVVSGLAQHVSALATTSTRQAKADHMNCKHVI